MNPQEISYALAKQVPDMAARGFTIHTAYGEITIATGWMAESIANHVRSVLWRENMLQKFPCPMPLLAVTVQDAVAAAEDMAKNVRWFDDYVTGKLTPDEYDTHGFKPGAGVIGGGYAHRQASQPCTSDATGQHAAPESQLPCDPAQPPATPETDGGHQ